MADFDAQADGLDEDLDAAYDEAFAEGADEDIDDAGTDEADDDAVAVEDAADDGADGDEADESDDGSDDDATDADDETSENDDQSVPEAGSEAPSHWTAEDKAAFDGLPDDLKPLWLEKSKQLEAGFQKKFQDVAARRKAVEDLEAIGTLFDANARQQLMLANQTPASFVGSLINAHNALANPATRTDALRHIAQQYGVNIDALAPSGQATDDDYVDPAELKRRMDAYEANQQQQQATATNAVHVETARYIDGFASELDANGELKHPHFATVRGLMGQIMADALSRGESPTMESAYEQAVISLVPEARQAVIDREVQARLSETAKGQSDRAKRAEKASRRPASRRLPKQAASTSRTLDEDLAEAYEELSS